MGDGEHWDEAVRGFSTSSERGETEQCGPGYQRQMWVQWWGWGEECVGKLAKCYSHKKSMWSMWTAKRSLVIPPRFIECWPVRVALLTHRCI